jgi:hypothetical protein
MYVSKDHAMELKEKSWGLLMVIGRVNPDRGWA